MKLVFAVIHNEDYQKVVEELNANSIGVTKLCSTGGFLKSGNTTLLIGVKEEMVETVIGIIKKNSKSRKQFINATIAPNGMGGVFTPYPVEIVIGGATIFVVDVESFYKGC